VGGNGRRRCSRVESRTPNQPAVRGSHHDVSNPGLVADVRDVPPIGRKLRKPEQRSVVGNTSLIEPVVVHHLYRIARHVRYPGTGNAVVTGQQLDDLIGELMRNLANLSGVARRNELVLSLYIVQIRVSREAALGVQI